MKEKYNHYYSLKKQPFYSKFSDFWEKKCQSIENKYVKLLLKMPSTYKVIKLTTMQKTFGMLMLAGYFSVKSLSKYFINLSFIDSI